MAGREIKGGIVLHPILATAILGAIVSFGVVSYTVSASRDAEYRKEQAFQHDKLIILTTQRDDDQKAASASRESARQEQEFQKLWREKLDKQMARLEAQNGVSSGGN